MTSISASEILTAVALSTSLETYEFAQDHETRDHILSRELQDTQRVTVLDGGVVGVEVLEECERDPRCLPNEHICFSRKESIARWWILSKKRQITQYSFIIHSVCCSATWSSQSVSNLPVDEKKQTSL